MSDERPALQRSSTEFSEEISKEEKGLLHKNKCDNADDNNSEDDEFPNRSSSITRTNNKKEGQLRSSVQPFLAGFLSNLVIVLLIRWTDSKGGENGPIIHCQESESCNESSSTTSTPPNVNISRPLFLNDTDSLRYLLDSKSGGGFEYSADYFLLQQGFDAQVNQAYCGVASVSTVMNSFQNSNNNHENNDIGIALPVDYEYDPYAYATQNDVLYNNDCVRDTVVYADDEFDGIFAAPYGLGMGQVQALTKCFFSASAGWQVTATHVDPSQVSVNQMRQDLIHFLTLKNARVMVNFDRSVVHEEGGGHWSPVGAYSVELDAFLILDVAKYKYPATWVPTNLLYKAMATIDDCGKWNFPQAQGQLSDELLYPETSKDYKKACQLLGCKQTYRGYVSVSHRARRREN